MSLLLPHQQILTIQFQLHLKGSDNSRSMATTTKKLKTRKQTTGHLLTCTWLIIAGLSITELCTRVTFDWTARGVARSDREGHTDNAAD